ncbi:amino acid ABC transporter substrate-binding protein/permease [Arthrobacter sp. AL08]|uniref:amino acid ABC transporter substrate-binding protein/permease n=1 Tax=Micrococcaceae TaxID=1268 RepID=UPI001CFFF352|nr:MULTISPECIES: amino acid ABC transporter substrate-binding protein/permease [Micrococcaceae]MCB5280614.1 Arginine transport system permease protein ArtQ [Arthrobacter sp. ES1]MDI3241655.1 amino acid ABC transporter substrate-binding protein/permease [Arthrobacter sp. AL05]MDI3277665.1 amino acid ABC transporter substrate-binding protein/permease [Arthrobacter sp. AL08]MDJ0353464.1 amino acid ABC transporter substrate-binding protein/permease [Pseudarthrobacter sp. PH31-O2]WGZ81327.1 amino a
MFFGAAGAAAAPDSAAPAAAQAGATPSSLSGKTFVIGTDTTFAPFEFRDTGGELTGIDMDIIREIARNQGFAVEIKSLGFNAALQALSSNQVDGVIAGMSITDQRKQIYDFSEPYFESGVQMAVAKANTDIKGYGDLKDKTVTAKTGSEGETFAKSIAGQYGFTVKSLDQSATMYELVKSGNAVAVFDDYPVLAYGISQNNGLKAVSEKEKGGSYGFAVNKGQNPELLQAFNTGLADLKSSGKYQEILDKYLKDPAQAVESSFWDLLINSFPALLKGLGNTVLVTGISFAVAMVVGLLMAFLKISTSLVLRGIATTYVSIFRGTPLLVWAFFFYFGIPQLTGAPIDIWVAGVLTLSLNSGAYITEIVRGSIQSVDPGQLEASRSLGLGYAKSMQKVVVPQAFKIMTPSLINQLIIMLKDSSLLLAIGFAELLYQGQQIYAGNFRITETLLIVAVLYFVVIMLLTKLANVADKRFNK